jgi:hypothetical protein
MIAFDLVPSEASISMTFLLYLCITDLITVKVAHLSGSEVYKTDLFVTFLFRSVVLFLLFAVMEPFATPG